MDITLSPITSYREKQYVAIRRVLTGTESLTIKAGYNLEVPNHWDLLSCRITATTDGTVANRYIRFRTLYDGNNSAGFKSPAVPASTTDNLFLNRTTYGENVDPFTSDNYQGIVEFFSLIAGHDYIICDLVNGVAGDSLIIYIVLMWKNHILGMERPEMFANKEYPE